MFSFRPLYIIHTPRKLQNCVAAYTYFCVYSCCIFFPFQQQRRENEESENGPNQSSGSSSNINPSDSSSGLGIATIVGGSLALIAALAAGAYFIHRNMRKWTTTINNCVHYKLCAGSFINIFETFSINIC